MVAEAGPDPGPAAQVEARAFVALDRLVGRGGGLQPDRGLGIALSGGGDSMALLHLAATWARGRRIAAVTLDHGLRPEAAAEAAMAGRAAAALGIPHRVLRWDGPTPQGNLAAQGRAARLALIGAWARAEGLAAVALGHTRDDVAETLLMRLMRGAGLDGLAAMADWRQDRGMIWLRPLLDLGRDELRDYLRARGVGWIDDPSNGDLKRDRPRVRAAMAALGLDPARLAESAAHLASARAALLPLIEAAVLDARIGPQAGAEVAGVTPTPAGAPRQGQADARIAQPQVGQAQAGLADDGLADDGLADDGLARGGQVQARLAQAGVAEEGQAQTPPPAFRFIQPGAADLILPGARFASAGREVRRIILVAAVDWITGRGYPPRRDTLIHALDRLASGRRVTLDGILITPGPTLHLVREPAAAARARPLTLDGIWDDRWVVTGLPAGFAVAALPGTAVPALWRDGACRGLLPRAGTTVRPLRSLADFHRKLGLATAATPEAH